MHPLLKTCALSTDSWWRAARHKLDGVSPLAILSPAYGRSMLNGRAVNDNALISRQGGIKYVFDQAGNLQQVPANTLAYDWSNGVRELLFEGSATNYVQNSVLAGAALGTIGSGGATPTGIGMSAAVAGDLTTEVTWIGTWFGAPAFDVRIHGQNTTTRYLNLWPAQQVPAVLGDVRTASCRASLVGGSTAGLGSLLLSLFERNSSGNNATGNPATSLDLLPIAASTERRVVSRTCTASDCAFVLLYIRVPVPTGPVDFTLRISIPQCEAGSVATSVIPTSGSTVTRTTDVAPLWSGAGAATAWAWRGVLPFVKSNGPLLYGDGGTYLTANATSTAILLSGTSLSTLTVKDVGLPGDVGIAVGWGASGRRGASSTNSVVSSSTPVDRDRSNMKVGGSALYTGMVLRVRELIAWVLPDWPSTAGIAAQAKLWSA
jgi:hypothetical protein